MVVWGTWQRHRRPSLACMTLNWVHSSFQPGGECIGGSWGLHLKEKRNKEHKYYTGGQSVSQCATGRAAKAIAVRQEVPGARLQRLCLHSGESVADWPAANSRATLRAKTSSFILPYSGAARERETEKKNNHTHKQCYIVSVQRSKLSQEISCEKMSDIYRQINGKLILISCHY